MTDRVLRRRVLGGCAAALAAPALLVARAAPRFAADPFTLGVASGYPTPDGIVLWTRLASDPLNGGGMPDAVVDVDWEVADDPAFARVVARGTAAAVPELAHSVHVEVRGLWPAREYWYRFRAADAASTAGRTHTAPEPGTPVAAMRFAFGSCQQYEQGYFAAYRDMAGRDLDLMVHLGDYIYETSWGSRLVRRHHGGIPIVLDEFRERYALYRTDRDLQAAHAAFPWLVTWDDHEVANDYTADRSPRTPDPRQFLKIRAAAYQAWYEHMPVPARMRPRGADAMIYGRHRFGDLVDIYLLDGRQYRSPHVCLPGRDTAPLVDCAARHAEERTYFGQTQEAWLASELRSVRGGWTVLAQQTLMAEMDRGGDDRHLFWMDGWDGYPAARRRLLDDLAARGGGDALVLSGDVHSFWAADLRRDFATTRSPAVATEFAGGAITAEGPSAKSVANALARNPHLKYGRADKRGYAIVALDKSRCEIEFRGVENEKDPQSAIGTLARFTVARGKPGVQKA
jgi:alkaline phosphatase D